jgi:NAD(P)-dependent dehydrogenase (short-subunit alcohol dehydrogenase family)
MSTQDIAGQVAIVTGGGTGSGRGAALALAAAGVKIVVLGRRLEPLQETVKAIDAAAGQAIALQANVAVAGAVSRLVEQAMNRLGQIDILINNNVRSESGPEPVSDAGRYCRSHSLAGQPATQYQDWTAVAATDHRKPVAMKG